jgi:signal transduction histidine kinase
MPDGGCLGISVELGDSLVKIKVMDSGLGIARGHLNRLDEPFFTTKSHAMGLGLSLGKKVLEQHGGTLSVEQNSSGGATVTLSLPFGESEQSGT